MAKKAAKESVERLHIIVRLIRRHGAVTLATLQKELEVHISTIKRDFAVLTDRLGCPLEYDVSKKGYVIRDEQLPGGGSFELPGLWFNASEVHALLAMLHLLRDVQPGFIESHLEPFKGRLRQLLGEGKHSVKNIEQRIKVIHFATRKVEVKHFELLTSAVLERRRLRLRYLNRDKQQMTEREISPLQLVYYRDNWLLDAWCHMRDGIRSFALDAIQQIAIIDKPAIEVSQDVLAAHFASGYGIYAGSASKRARLKFTPERARYVSLESWHPDQSSEWLADGSFILEVPYSMEHELLMDLLRYGADVEVLAPADLRQQVARALCAAARKYQMGAER